MERWRSRVAMAALALAVVGSRAAAEETSSPDEFTRRGAFVGLGFSYQVPGFQGDFRDLDFGDSWGFNARGGYRFFDWLAVEGVADYADDFGASDGDQSFKLFSATGNAKLILPLGRFQPYLGAGIGLLWATAAGRSFFELDDVDVGFAGRVGGGLDLYVTPHVSLYVDNAWTMATPDAADLYYYSLGVGGRYNF